MYYLEGGVLIPFLNSSHFFLTKRNYGMKLIKTLNDIEIAASDIAKKYKSIIIKEEKNNARQGNSSNRKRA